MKLRSLEVRKCERRSGSKFTFKVYVTTDRDPRNQSEEVRCQNEVTPASRHRIQVSCTYVAKNIHAYKTREVIKTETQIRSQERVERKRNKR